MIPLSAVLGAGYRLDSRLFVLDPAEMWTGAYGNDIPSALRATTVYYRWTGTRMVKVDSARVIP